MFSVLCLGSLLVLSVQAIYCPPGYTDGGDGSCYGGPYFSVDRNNANKYCSQNGGYLYNVQNGYANSDIQKRGAKYSSVWLGLTCTSNNTNSCQWDDGTQLSNSSYTNFAAGGFDVTLGACVVMQIKTGFWYSADCTNSQAYYGCKYTQGVQVPRCTAPGAVTFRGKCYYAVISDGLADASNTCKQSCGNVASIHSDGENAFIRNLASSSNTGYLMTGLKMTSSYQWQDGSIYDYTNFGMENPQLGSCVSMALADGFVKSGKWISSQCESSSRIVSVCEKDVDNACDKPTTTTTTTTTAASTMAPPQCGDPTAYSDQGLLYSPGYPFPSTPNHCEYLITENQSKKASVLFLDGLLDEQSYIYLYSGILETTPYKILRNTPLKNIFSLSPTNVIRMVYNTTGNIYNKNLWSTQYQGN